MLLDLVVLKVLTFHPFLIKVANTFWYVNNILLITQLLLSEKKHTQLSNIQGLQNLPDALISVS